MDCVEKEIGEDCPLCNQIKEKIDSISILKIPQDFFLVTDYVYYKERKLFERGGRLAAYISIDGQNAMKGLPLSALKDSIFLNYQ